MDLTQLYCLTVVVGQKSGIGLTVLKSMCQPDCFFLQALRRICFCAHSPVSRTKFLVGEGLRTHFMVAHSLESTLGS